jgi:hypothetical protein
MRYEVIAILKNDRVDIKDHLLEEGLLDDLLLEIKSSPYLDGLTTYEKVLYKDYKLELLDLFKARVTSMAESSGNRNHYKNIVREIKHIRKYPSGKDIANELVELFSSKYKNRRAMLDEFKKAKLI